MAQVANVGLFLLVTGIFFTWFVTGISENEGQCTRDPLGPRFSMPSLEVCDESSSKLIPLLSATILSVTCVASKRLLSKMSTSSIFALRCVTRIVASSRPLKVVRKHRPAAGASI